MHYIFYRPGDVTIILRCSKKRYPFIEDSDVFHMISDYESSSYDDWSSRLEGDINRTNQKIIKEIVAEYEKIAGRKMPGIEKFAQPSLVQIQSAKLLDGVIDGHDNDFRDYRVEFKSEKTDFIQIKD
ncbi:hypothetical protein KAJ61_01360 [Candidatus Parcubacteria bacterium]|nr:hypothetical protein [Candidatus Parcubacteria bacterium]